MLMAKKKGKPPRKKCKPRKAYLCGTAWDHDMLEARDGVRIYPSVQDLAREKNCIKECGVFEVEVRYVRTIRKPTLTVAERNAVLLKAVTAEVQAIPLPKFLPRKKARNDHGQRGRG
jgi:hypothetical protein